MRRERDVETLTRCTFVHRPGCNTESCPETESLYKDLNKTVVRIVLKETKWGCQTDKKRRPNNKREQSASDDRTEAENKPSASIVLTRREEETSGAERTRCCRNRHTSSLMRNHSDTTRLSARNNMSDLRTDHMKLQVSVQQQHSTPTPTPISGSVLGGHAVHESLLQK